MKNVIGKIGKISDDGHKKRVTLKVSGARPVQRVSLNKVPPRGRENVEESLLTPVSVEIDGESIFFRPRKAGKQRRTRRSRRKPH